MKKHCLKALTVLLLIAAMAMPLIACTDKEPSEETTAATGDSTEETTEATTEPETPLPTEVDLPDAYATADIVYDCDDGSVLHNYTGKTADDFATVCAYYTEKGFKVYSSHTMAENTATTFVGDGPMAHVYWLKAKGELNIVLSDTAANSLPPMTPAVTDGEYECSIVQLKDNTNVNGMSYVIQLKDGSYIVYDGSYVGQARKLQQYLIANYKGEGKPVVRAWVLTHSHNDHYPTFQAFATNSRYMNMVTVEYVIYSPLNEENYTLNDENNDPYFSTQLYEDVKGMKGAKLVFAHTGMLFNFCNLNMEILMAPETLYKDTSDVGNFNDTSIVTRLFDDDYNALFLGDIAIKGSTYMHEIYGSYLKSDVCQVSHHGVEDVPLSFYEEVKASILYYPCNIWLYDLQDRNDDVRIALENRDYTKEILIAGCGEYKRAWGTKFAADAPLSIPDYTVPAHKQPATEPETQPPVVTPDEPRLILDKTTYKVGEPIMTTVIGSGTDWVGIQTVELFEQGQGSAYWWYVTSVGSGTPFDMLAVKDGSNLTVDLPAGEYIVRLVANDHGFQSTTDTISEIRITIEE